MIRSSSIALIVLAAIPGGDWVRVQAPPPPPQLVVKFDYDFDKNPACPPGYQPQPVAKKKKKSKANSEIPVCVDLFNVYDISNGTDEKNKYFLFSVPLPDPPVGRQPITKSVTLPNFEPGRHKISAAAHSPDTGDSDLNACWVIVKITREDLARLAASRSSPAPATPPAGSLSAPSSTHQQVSPPTSPQGTPQTPRRAHPPSC